MYSRIAQFFEGWNFVDFRGVFFAAAIASCAAGFFLKYAWRRRNYLRGFPARKVSLFNVWGNVADFKNTVRKDGVGFEVYILQVLMGNMHLFKKESFFYFGLSYIPMIVVTKAKAVEELIAGSKNMQKNWIYDWLHPWLGTGLLTSYGSKWKSRRKLLTNSFHFDILKDFLHIFNEQSQLLVELLEKETEQPWIDIVKPITLCSLDIVCETTLGISVGAQKNIQSEYVQAVLRASRSVMTRLTNPLYYTNWCYNMSREGCQFKKDLKLLHSFTRGVIASKKQTLLSTPKEIKGPKKRKALMDLLLEEHVQNGSLSEEDIREEVDTFAFEGHDTTSMGMSWSLYLIGLYKDVQEKLMEEIDRIFGEDYERPVTTEDLNYADYLDRVLKESLRLYPSVPFFARKLSEDSVIGGVKVPKDVGVMVLTYGLHRDENVYPNPEKFDPDRFLPENTAKRSPFAYVPFSAGPRNCIGQKFAMMEEKVVILNVLRNYTIESLDPRDKVLEAPELILRSSGPIRIKLISKRSNA